MGSATTAIDGLAARGAMGAAEAHRHTPAGRRERIESLRALIDWYASRDPEAPDAYRAELATLEARK